MKGKQMANISVDKNVLTITFSKEELVVLDPNKEGSIAATDEKVKRFVIKYLKEDKIVYLLEITNKRIPDRLVQVEYKSFYFDNKMEKNNEKPLVDTYYLEMKSSTFKTNVAEGKHQTFVIFQNPDCKIQAIVPYFFEFEKPIVISVEHALSVSRGNKEKLENKESEA